MNKINEITGFNNKSILERKIKTILKSNYKKNNIEIDFIIDLDLETNLMKIEIIEDSDEIKILETIFLLVEEKSNKLKVLEIVKEEDLDSLNEDMEINTVLNQLENKTKKTKEDKNTIKTFNVIKKLKEKGDYVISDDQSFYRYNKNKYENISVKEFQHLISKYDNDITTSMETINEIQKRLANRFYKKFEWNDCINKRKEVVFNNCVYNFKNGETREITKKCFIDTYVNSSFVKTNNTPTKFLKFLEESLLTKNEINLLQEWIGYSFKMEADFKNFMVIKGVTNSGKSVLIKVIEGLIGSENTCSLRPKDMEKDEKAYTIKGKLLNVVPELSKYEKISDDIKKFTSGSGDSISIRKLFCQPELYVPFAKTIISTNFDVKFDDDDSGALAGRMLLVEFNRSVPEDEINRNIINEILEEKEELINWGLEGLKRLEENRYFTKTKNKDRILEDKKANENYVFRFILDKDIREKIIILDDLKNMYEEWAIEEGLKYTEITLDFLRKKLKEIENVSIKRVKVKVNGNYENKYEVTFKELEKEKKCLVY